MQSLRPPSRFNLRRASCSEGRPGRHMHQAALSLWRRGECAHLRRWCRPSYRARGWPWPRASPPWRRETRAPRSLGFVSRVYCDVTPHPSASVTCTHARIESREEALHLIAFVLQTARVAARWASFTASINSVSWLPSAGTHTLNVSPHDPLLHPLQATVQVNALVRGNGGVSSRCSGCHRMWGYPSVSITACARIS